MGRVAGSLVLAGGCVTAPEHAANTLMAVVLQMVMSTRRREILFAPSSPERLSRGPHRAIAFRIATPSIHARELSIALNVCAQDAGVNLLRASLDNTPPAAYKSGVSTALGVAAASFEDALCGLGLSGADSTLGDLGQFGRWAAQAAAAGALWHVQGVAPDDPLPPCGHCGPAGALWHVRFGPLLDTRWAQALLRIPTHQGLHDLIEAQELLAVSSHAGQTQIPVFQFGDDGRPYAWLAPVMHALAEVEITGWKVATWLFTANPELGGRAPIAWLKDGRELEAVLVAAPNAPAMRAAAARSS